VLHQLLGYLEYVVKWVNALEEDFTIFNNNFESGARLFVFFDDAFELHQLFVVVALIVADFELTLEARANPTVRIALCLLTQLCVDVFYLILDNLRVSEAALIDDSGAQLPYDRVSWEP
jgi:hypothetical protein